MYIKYISHFRVCFILNKFINRKRKIRLLTFLTSILIFIVLLDFHLRPIIKSMAESKTHTISNDAIDDAVLKELSENNVKYSSLVHIDKAEDGSISSIVTDTQTINSLKSKIATAIQNNLSKIDLTQIEVPIGTLIGTDLLNGRGPVIKLKVSISGSSCVEFTSKFCEAGINQTKHQIYLDINTKINLLVPGYPTSTDIHTNMIIAEMIVVGKVPRVYSTNDKHECFNILDQ